MIYSLWRIIRISTYRPFTFPSNFQVPKMLHILPVCYIISWIHSESFVNTRLNGLIMRAYRIYGASDKVRVSQGRRWGECCHHLWELEQFRSTRHSYWNHLGIPPSMEPRNLGSLWEGRENFLDTVRCAERKFAKRMRIQGSNELAQ